MKSEVILVPPSFLAALMTLTMTRLRKIRGTRMIFSTASSIHTIDESKRSLKASTKGKSEIPSALFLKGP